jgi:hypothetical protein
MQSIVFMMEAKQTAQFYYIDVPGKATQKAPHNRPLGPVVMNGRGEASYPYSMPAAYYNHVPVAVYPASISFPHISAFTTNSHAQCPNHRHPISPILQSPVTLHQKGRISRKSPKDTHTPKIPYRPTDPIIAKLTLESQSTLSLCDTEREERGHDIVERLAVSAV